MESLLATYLWLLKTIWNLNDLQKTSISWLVVAVAPIASYVYCKSFLTGGSKKTLMQMFIIKWECSVSVGPDLRPLILKLHFFYSFNCLLCSLSGGFGLSVYLVGPIVGHPVRSVYQSTRQCPIICCSLHGFSYGVCRFLFLFQLLFYFSKYISFSSLHLFVMILWCIMVTNR